MYNRELHLYRFVQQPSVSDDEVTPERQDGSLSMNHIKEEEEEVWTGQEKEWLPELENIFTPVLVKCEDEEEKLEFEEYGGEELARSSSPDQHLQPNSTTEERLEPEAEMSSDDITVGGAGLGFIGDLPEKSFQCCMRDKRFSRTSKPKRPKMTHCKEKPSGSSRQFKKRKFGRESLLWTNQELQKPEEQCEVKAVVCPICGKRFCQRGDLRRHLKSHTGEKPLSCSVCGRTFTRLTNLVKHILGHTGKKPYSCSVCTKSFSSEDYIRSHMRIHTGEKPFSCSACGRSFMWHPQLKRHKCGDVSTTLRPEPQLEKVTVTVTPVQVKREDDGDRDEPPSSWLHQTEQMKKETDAEA
ncbi:zinc finger protein 180-like isoform X2 [Antennarius striatus]|uniref:zinc finger protein 180-like isoform X2 n=1 Tax=Antennarius striatus TaxID=241820 RepID=UPI0035B3671F